jgi:hypothetical protein
MHLQHASISTMPEQFSQLLDVTMCTCLLNCMALFFTDRCYLTLQQINAWEAHTDYIRYLEVHPSLPYVLSCSDDMSIKVKCWN